jgi:adenine-specific DNA-methyltransferase
MDKKKWGRFFTQKNWILDELVNLIKNTGSILEPCCGVGHIIKKLEEQYNDITSIDIIESSQICNLPMININFFDYPISNLYNTIITNPPYVIYRLIDSTILRNWKSCLPRLNLYMYFIEKCFYHLKENGEMIFIIPIDFINNTRGEQLRRLLYENGTTTHIINLSDRSVFSDCSPEVIIIRYEKDNFTHKLNYKKTLEEPYKIISDKLFNGTYNFDIYSDYKYIKDYFIIKVGIVIGCNKIFEKDSILSKSIIMSDYYLTKKKRNFLFLENLTLDQIKEQNIEIYNYLIKNKERLMSRKARKYSEDNWWKWSGYRNSTYMTNDKDCIFVNQRTRCKFPFFIDRNNLFDGSLLCLIPKMNVDLNEWINILNNNKEIFESHGLLINNKYMFNKIKLENIKIPCDLLKNIK